MSDATSGRARRGQGQDGRGLRLLVDPDTIAGPYVDVTVDHLFGAVWTREALDIRDRRMLTIGVLAALGQAPICSRSSSGPPWTGAS